MYSYRLSHLEHLTTHIGIHEHALLSEPRPEHGYCTDDNARLAIVMSREPDEGAAHRMMRTALAFVLDSQADSGLVRNRFMLDGYWRWVDSPRAEDAWGRALWALGTVAAAHPNPGFRAMARWGFERSARQRSPWRRSMTFAALGAADLLGAEPEHHLAHRLLVDAVMAILPPGHPDGVWPEERLTYANAALPEALIAAGAVLDAPVVLARGLGMLDWLLRRQIRDGHLSVVGAGGAPLLDGGPRFDQQPIEVAALADACWRAWTVTGDRRWEQGLILAGDWFLGANDTGVPMVDPVTGGGYDGLEPDGVNLNQGAESTLALVSTMQRASSVWSLRPLAAQGRR